MSISMVLLWPYINIVCSHTEQNMSHDDPSPYLRALSEKIKISVVLSQNQPCYEKKMSVDGMIVDCLQVVSLYLLSSTRPIWLKHRWLWTQKRLFILMMWFFSLDIVFRVLFGVHFGPFLSFSVPFGPFRFFPWYCCDLILISSVHTLNRTWAMTTPPPTYVPFQKRLKLVWFCLKTNLVMKRKCLSMAWLLIACRLYLCIYCHLLDLYDWNIVDCGRRKGYLY